MYSLSAFSFLSDVGMINYQGKPEATCCCDVRKREGICDASEQQTSLGGCGAVHPHNGRLRHQLRANHSISQRRNTTSLSLVHVSNQPRQQLLHLPGGEQGVPERGQEFSRCDQKESATQQHTTSTCWSAVAHAC